MVPMAVLSGALAPVVGRLTEHAHPRWFAAGGRSLLSVSLFWLAWFIGQHDPVWRLLLPIALLGVGQRVHVGTDRARATRNLPPRQAGAGSGVYNTTRQVGACWDRASSPR